MEESASESAASAGVGDVREVCDLSRPAVLEDLNFIRPEVRDRLAVTVQDDRVNLHQVGRDTHDLFFALLRRRRWP
ncbi:MAG: hypothetical protein LC795_15055 [Acidobacteria bacterium]|nr:hypothetical protein [Acidobacteriota bacterium]MCA1620594.1 hypothetical protein [Acidobacteriota bacterium]